MSLVERTQAYAAFAHNARNRAKSRVASAAEHQRNASTAQRHAEEASARVNERWNDQVSVDAVKGD